MKIVGFIFIIISAISSSIIYEKREREKLNYFNQLVDFIAYIKKEISHFNLPIDEIYKRSTNKSPLIEEITAKNYANLSFLDENCNKETVEFFKTIGQGFKDEQITRCNLLINTLNKALDTQKNDYKNKVKVFRVMAFFISACIIIFLA